jgi:ABC-type phosphate/phosphonate transport system substrate-binding protein
MYRPFILPALLVLATTTAAPPAMSETRTGAASVPAVKSEKLKPTSLAAPEQLTSPAATGLAAGAPLVLAAPPRDSTEEGHRIFDPVARYLSTVLGRPVIYKHPTTWGGYQADMQAGAYDIVFDGPHFNSWRVASRGHNVLVKIPGEFVYTAFVRKDNIGFTQLKQLAGRRVCAHAPPNLGTLIMYNEFDNPARQPVLIIEDGYKQIYTALLEGRCDAAMLPLGHLEKFDKEQNKARIIFRTAALPQQAFSAGPRLTAAEQGKIAEALLARDATALAEFRKVYGFQGNFVRATNAEYADLAKYLRDMWGYN